MPNPLKTNIYITNDNIQEFVNNYLTNKGKLPDSLKNVAIGNWDVSRVTNMSRLFEDAPFNENISGWDVSNVEDMSKMFRESSFNSSIENWDVSSVTNMRGMFEYAYEFNQPLNEWGNKTMNVKDMTGMFYSSPKFNQPLNEWNVSNVMSMAHMFDGAKEFNQNLNDWTIPYDVNIQDMFKGAERFDMNNGPSREVTESDGEEEEEEEEINGYSVFKETEITNLNLLTSDKTILSSDTVYDIKTNNTVVAGEYLKQSNDNIIFKYGEEHYGVYRGDIIRAIKDSNNIIYGCKTEYTEDLPKLQDITFTEPCFSLISMGINIGGLILLSELKAALVNKDRNTFEIIEEPIDEYIATASLKSIQDDNRNLSRNLNSAHCQPDSGEYVHNIEIIIEHRNSGGRRRKLKTKRRKGTRGKKSIHSKQKKHSKKSMHRRNVTKRRR